MSVGDTGKIENTLESPAAIQEGARINVQLYPVVAGLMKATACNFIQRYALSLSEYT